MTARILLLMVAVAGLTACESTKAVDTSTPTAPAAVQVAAPAPAEQRIVRSPLVPDDEETDVAMTPAPKKHRVQTADAASAEDTTVDEPVADPVAKPAKPAKPAKTETAKTEAPKTEAPVTTADASKPTDTTPPADAGPTPADTAPETGTPADTQPAATDKPAKSLFSDPQALIQAQVGGFPVWLIALVGVVLLAALLIGFGGRKKSEEVV